MSDGEDDVFTQCEMPVAEAPEVIAARKEEARKQEAKEKLKKSTENQLFQTKLSIVDDLNNLQQWKLDLGHAKSNNKVSNLKKLDINGF